MSANNRSSKKKTSNKAGSSRSAMKQPLPLNDGMYRRSWKVPSTEEEWANFLRTNADRPITEEERSDWEDATLEYMNTPPYNPPPVYSDRFANSDPNPPASQVMPAKLKAAIMEANEEITALGVKWNNNRALQFEKETNIMEKKMQLAALEQQISQEENAVREIKEEYDVLEDKINEKAKWIIQCQNIYPY